MSDMDYVLELQIPAADQLWIPDQDGIDRISVLHAHEQPVEITLAYQVTGGGTAFSALAFYYGLEGRCHRMIIYGVVEHATGSPGVDRITGNELGNLLAGEAHLLGPGGADTIHGGRGNDTVLGGVGTDLLTGDDGDDAVSGHAGADTLLGGAGRDTLAGGAGADVIDGGSDAGDMVSYAASQAGVRITLHPGAVSDVQGGDAEGDILLGVSAVIGSSKRDRIVDAAKTALAQGANANLFQGGGGRDKLTLGGGNDTGQGGLGNDILTGEGGHDDLQGGGGADRLSGGAGHDSLTGGLGADRFLFLRLTDSSADAETCDRITDFSPTEGDLISLAALDADLASAGNQAFQLVDGGFTGQAGELIQTFLGDGLLLQADVTGDGLCDFALWLEGLALLEVDALLL